MPDHFDEAVAGLRALRPEYRERRIKVTGFLNADGTVGPNPTEGAQPGYVYVHNYYRGGGNVQVIAGTAINPYIPNLLVWVGENHANQAVAYALVIDKNAVDQFGTALGAAGSNPAPVEQTTIVVPASNVGGGRVLPNAPTFGQTVYVEGYTPALWTGAPLAIDPADFPSSSNGLRWAVFYLADAEPGSPHMPDYVLTDEQTGTDISTLLVSTADQVVLPNGAIRLFAVSLYNGQTDLTAQNTRWVDLRNWLNQSGVVPSTQGWVMTHDTTLAAGHDYTVLGTIYTSAYTLAVDGYLTILG